MPDPIRGINSENYYAMAKAFFLAQEHGFCIVRDEASAITDFPPTPREFGAWAAYFTSRRIRAGTIKQLGRGTVPARWPHEFDADWSSGNDERAADYFEGMLADERRDLGKVLSVEARKAIVTKRLGYDPAKTRGTYREEGLTEKPLKFIDKDLLFKCHDEALAAEAKRQKSKNNPQRSQPVDTHVSDPLPTLPKEKAA